jgi:competence protein ComEA
MQRQSQAEVAAAARRRLELLARELDQAGLRRVDERAEEVVEAPEESLLPEAARVEPAGRHLHAPQPGLGSRLGGWIGEQVPATFRGRTGLEPGPVHLVAVLVALALTATIYVLLRGGGDAEAVRNRSVPALPSTSSSPLVPLASPVASPAATTPGAASASGAGTVTVDVAGKVRRPGVVTMPAGARVVDALHKAGGARGRVDLSSLNLARVLVDGEQILVGRDAVAPGGLAASASTAAPDATSSLVSLNTATAEQLETLPGVGPVTAQKILDWRAANGAFSSVDELLEIDGIGEKTLADLAPHVTL